MSWMQFWQNKQQERGVVRLVCCTKSPLPHFALCWMPTKKSMHFLQFAGKCSSSWYVSIDLVVSNWKSVGDSQIGSDDLRWIDRSEKFDFNWGDVWCRLADRNGGDGDATGVILDIFSIVLAGRWSVLFCSFSLAAWVIFSRRFGLAQRSITTTINLLCLAIKMLKSSRQY